MNVDARAEAWVSARSSRGVAPRPLVELLRAFGEPGGACSPRRRRSVAGRRRSGGRSALDARPDAGAARRTLALARRSRATTSSPGTTPTIRARCSRSAIRRRCFYCLGRRELLARPALAIVGSRNATPQGCADARGVRARAVGRRAHDRERPGARHRRRRASRRARRRGQQHRGRRHRSRSRLSGAQSRARARARRARARHLRIRAGHAAAAAELSAAQSR